MFNKILKIISFIIVFILIINIFVLDWYLFYKEKPAEKTISPLVTEKIENQLSISPVCPTQCLSLINEATASFKIPTPQIVKETKYETVQSGGKEVIIPLGVGSTTSVNYLDLEGIEAYIDSSKYPNYKEVYFEASLRIPSGNGKATAQLYNVSDKHPVWYSEVTLEGSTPKMIISPKINLDSGNKLYRVQLKSSMSAAVYLDNARIRIVF